MRRGGGIWLVAIVLMVVALVGATPPGADAESGACAEPNKLEQQTKLDSARDAYDEVLDDDPGAACATAGIRRIAQEKNKEAAACERGKTLDKAKEPEQADAAYVDAVRINVESECGKKGLNPPEEDENGWDRVGDAIAYLPKIPAALGALLLIVLGTFAFFGLLVVIARRRRPSLVVRPFIDEAVDDKVGSGFGGLVEQRMLAVARKAQRSSALTYDLDLVVADVELLDEEEDLAAAVGGIADLPQMAVVVAVLGFVDRLIGKRRLAIGGELLPEGDAGPGVAMALYRRNAVRARGVLWTDEVAEWLELEPGEEPEPPAEEPAPAWWPAAMPAGQAAAEPPPPGPAQYYRFAAAAAAWSQYEAGRDLDAQVDLMTTSAESFALLSMGLGAHREDRLAEAADFYTRALERDGGNVGALVNLAIVVAREGEFDESILLVTDAITTLEARYVEARSRQWRPWRLANAEAPA